MIGVSIKCQSDTIFAVDREITHSIDGKIERSMKITNGMNLKINFNIKRVDYLMETKI